MSHRKVALLGAVLSSAGLIAMPFAPNLVYMYGFYGILSGNKKDTSSYYQVPLYMYLYLILTMSRVDNLQNVLGTLFFFCYPKQMDITNATVSKKICLNIFFFTLVNFSFFFKMQIFITRISPKKKRFENACKKSRENYLNIFSCAIDWKIECKA